MRKFYQEFKDFALKGNMIDMAIGIIIGVAFNNVVGVLVKKVIMPPLTLISDGVSLSEKKYLLREATEGVTELAIGYGELIEVLIDFSIITFTVFLVVKFMNRFRRKADDPKDKEIETPKNIELLSNIEKLLEAQNSYLKNKKD
ncbi:MAG: large conductance mechanosensitive channel [Flavobacteriaceae bacterium]|jgi:large conductance mechanosensitive channel|uniref:large conductance mechanosensitive channel protein MscL n=1 Tax=Candidatus Marifrigoribacter sp. Uisw_064 TaxID=3230970 RepID=UPI003AE61F2C